MDNRIGLKLILILNGVMHCFKVLSANILCLRMSETSKFNFYTATLELQSYLVVKSIT